jgi:hypothetical protein
VDIDLLDPLRLLPAAEQVLHQAEVVEEEVHLRSLGLVEAEAEAVVGVAWLRRPKLYLVYGTLDHNSVLCFY